MSGTLLRCARTTTALLAGAWLGAALAQPPADVVVTNGKILTVDANLSMVAALAIDAGRIVAAGTSDMVRRYVGPETQVIDVGGATVVPGLIDNHFHFARAVQRWHLQVRLDGVASRREALRLMAAKAERSTPASGSSCRAVGRRSSLPISRAASRSRLDAVAPRNRAVRAAGLQHRLCNSLALRAVGLEPKDGARRDAAGLATFQPPYGAFIQSIPPTTPEQFEANLTDFMRTLNSVGLTGVYSLGRGPEGESERIEARALREDLPLRIWETLTFERPIRRPTPPWR
jgi:predicted amidohydrolase YtcJ